MIVADALLSVWRWFVFGTAASLAAVSLYAAFGPSLPRGLPRPLLPWGRTADDSPADLEDETTDEAS